MREATAADYEAVAALFLEGDWHHHRGVPAVFAAPSAPARSREYVEEILGNDRMALLVAEHDGKVVGFVQIEERSAPDLAVFVPDRYLVVDSMVVTERLRGAGVGHALMAAAHD